MNCAYNPVISTGITRDCSVLNGEGLVLGITVIYFIPSPSEQLTEIMAFYTRTDLNGLLYRVSNI